MDLETKKNFPNFFLKFTQKSNFLKKPQLLSVYSHCLGYNCFLISTLVLIRYQITPIKLIPNSLEFKMRTKNLS